MRHGVRVGLGKERGLGRHAASSGASLGRMPRWHGARARCALRDVAAQSANWLKTMLLSPCLSTIFSKILY
jgi:hypothetical protein